MLHVGVLVGLRISKEDVGRRLLDDRAADTGLHDVVGGLRAKDHQTVPFSDRLEIVLHGGCHGKSPDLRDLSQ